MQKTVLIVDDDKWAIKKTASILKNAGFSIMTARSGTDALTISQVKSPDIIILDVLMTEMDGFETFGNFKQQPATREVPVIFVSALDGDSIRRTALEMGAAGFLGKPAADKQLVEKVTASIENSDYLFTRG